MLLALAIGCAPAPGEPEVLLTGWEYDWEELSHRIALLRVGVEPDSSLLLGLVGGDWSTGAAFTDTPHYRVRYQQVQASGLDVVRGTATFQVGPDPDGATTLVLDVSGIPDTRTLVPILNGFSIDTGIPQSAEYPSDYDASFGYASNGFGFSLGDPVREGDSVSIPVAATVRWGPQDREDMNAAIPYAVTGVTVDVALLAVTGDVQVETANSSAAYEQDPPYTDQPPMATTVAFDQGDREGIVGWKSFDLQANLAGPSEGEGDYLRAFGAELVPTAAAPGTWNGDIAATITTSSAIEFTQLTAGFQGEIVRIGAPNVVAEHVLVTGQHPTGLAVTGPTLPD